jgi:hypothetical protein
MQQNYAQSIQADKSKRAGARSAFPLNGGAGEQ